MHKAILDPVQSVYYNRLRAIYQKARSAEDLPWYSPGPPPLLVTMVEQRNKPGRVLDLGCGTGTNAIYLAQRDYQVTAIDYVREAIDFTRESAKKSHVDITLVHTDILSWPPRESFDFVLDAGCLHNLPSPKRTLYRKKLMEWLDPGADYALIHFDKRHRFDICPIGPRRVTRKNLVKWFAPELEELAYFRRDRSMPFPIGPVVSIGSFWFRRQG